MNDRITVAIATYNRSIELTQLLTSLIGQTNQNFDVVIYDDSEIPTPRYPYFWKTIKFLKKKKHRVVYEWGLQEYDRKGIAFARNQANRLAETNLIVRVDDDSIMDPRYLETLLHTYKVTEKEFGNVAAVGGIVPHFFEPFYYVEAPDLFTFNEIEVNQDGKVMKINDDGGFSWIGPTNIYKSHHLRSSFLYRKDLHDEVGGHPVWTGSTGFREETILTNKFLFYGYKLFTNIQAICWHNRGETGGCRPPNYQEQVKRIDDYYKNEWVPKMTKKYGSPFRLVKG